MDIDRVDSGGVVFSFILYLILWWQASGGSHREKQARIMQDNKE